MKSLVVFGIFIFLVLASSGIDYDVKIWMPTSEEICFDSEKANEVSIFSFHGVGI